MNNLRNEDGLTEEEFLSAYDQEKYKKPSLTADVCIFRKTDDGYDLLMIKRRNHPYMEKWALPGGFAEEGETIEETAKRELGEETGITGADLNLVGIYSKPGRDPRGWTVSAAYGAVVNGNDVNPVAADDAADAKWFHIVKRNRCMAIGNVGSRNPFSLIYDGKPVSCKEIAFDHTDIIMKAVATMIP